MMDEFFDRYMLVNSTITGWVYQIRRSKSPVKTWRKTPAYLNRQVYYSLIRKEGRFGGGPPVGGPFAVAVQYLPRLFGHIAWKKSSGSFFTGEGQGHNAMIVNRIRLPMALMAVAVGACLGIGGCEIQTILRNPIASPYTLGITNAASFGAALGLILDANVLNVSEPLMVTANAFTFALLASFCVYAFSRRRGAGKHTIILFGIALNFLFTALTMILQYIADDEDLQSLVFWNMGSLLKTTWLKFWLVFAILLFCFAVFYKNSWKLTAMTLEDTKARSLGVDTHKIRRMVIFLASLLTAFAVCFVGPSALWASLPPISRASMWARISAFSCRFPPWWERWWSPSPLWSARWPYRA